MFKRGETMTDQKLTLLKGHSLLPEATLATVLYISAMVVWKPLPGNNTVVKQPSLLMERF